MLQHNLYIDINMLSQNTFQLLYDQLLFT